MASVNRAILIGNLGKDPEVRSTRNGTQVCQFSLATTKKRKDDQGQTHEKTEWHRVVVWHKQAENCAQYLKKGSPAYVEGEITTRKWKDKQGIERYATEIQAQTVRFLNSSRGAASEPPPPEDSDGPTNNSSFDDIPW